MIGEKQWRAYNEAVAAITDAARDRTREELAEWLAEHDATVAEAREAARRILAANAGVYNQAASALAAEWYDAQGKAAGVALDRAVTSVTVDRDSLSKTVRYQAQKLVGGDVDGFCDAMAEWAENEAKIALNSTIMANAKRDRKRGVKFARVTSGRNTCAFCLMLASRGAVYHTRESAGELGRFHRHCSCKIVPGYSGDKYEVLVEGHDPKKIENRLIEVERLTGTRRNTPEFAREVSLRDPNWLFGDSAATDYTLNAAKNYGRLIVPGDFSEENIVDRGNEWRDLWVHYVLGKNGISAQAQGPAKLDLIINGEWWEVKSPYGDGSSPRFVESSVKKASKQFEKRGIKPKRIVFNPRYRGCDEEAVKKELKRQMKCHGVSEAMFINDDGSITRLEA